MLFATLMSTVSECSETVGGLLCGQQGFLHNNTQYTPLVSLIPTLTAQQKETFEKLKDCEAELHGMNEREAFISGFKLAARIMTEVLCKPSED